MAKNILIFLIIALACISVYYRTLSYGFTYHDDNIIVLENLPFLKDLSNIPKAIVSDAWFKHKQIELYRPLQNVSFMIDAQMGRDIIYSAHVTNLILHILCCLAVFYLLTLFRIEDKYALIGALTYAVHFLFLHAVIWIPARGDLLLALFSFLSMITFILIIRAGHWYHYALNIITFGLALFAKETAVVLPFLFLVYLFLFPRNRVFTKGNLILASCYLLIFIFFYFLRSISITKEEQSIGFMPLLLNLQTIPETIVKLFVPVNFSTMPSFKVLASISGTLIISGFALLFLVKRPYFDHLILFSIIWFALFLLPGMAYRPAFASYTYEYLDHRAYLPAFGMLMILLNLVQRFEQRMKKFNAGTWIMVISFIFLFYLGIMNFHIHGIYKNALSYSESAITVNTRCSLGYFIHGKELYQLGKKDSALIDFSNAVKYYPDFFDARYNKALILNEKGRYNESMSDLDYIAAFKAQPDARFYSLRGVVRSHLGDYNGAETDFQTALQLNPGYSEAAKNLDVLHQTLKNVSASKKYQNEAEKLNDDGVALARSGNYREALRLFEKSFSKEPTFYEALVNIGNCRHALGDIKAACACWKTAAEHGNQAGQGLLNQYCK